MTRSDLIDKGKENSKENAPPCIKKEMKTNSQGPLRSICQNRSLSDKSTSYNLRSLSQNVQISKEDQQESNKKTTRKANTQRYLDSDRFKDLNVSDEWLTSKEKNDLYNSICKENHESVQKEASKQYYKLTAKSKLDSFSISNELKRNSNYVYFTPTVEKTQPAKDTDSTDEFIKKNKDQFLFEKQLEKLLLLDSQNNESESATSLIEMPPEKSSLIYEPLHISDTNKSDLFTADSVQHKLTHFDHKLESLRNQLEFFNSLNKQKSLNSKKVNTKYTYIIDFINQTNQIEQMNQFNFMTTKEWYSNKKLEINNDHELECKNLRSEFEFKKEKLKETFMEEQKEDNRRCQAKISKIEIDSSIKKITIDSEEAKSQLNKPAVNSNHLINKTPIYTTNLLARSKKRLAVPKLRPRLNGRASVAPLEMNQKNNKKNNHVHHSIPKQAANSETRIYINKKSKPTSIENRLKIKFTLHQEEINDDLKFLNNNH